MTILSLRRSCRRCVVAKRRCDLEAPRCGRCSARRLPCHYANEPVGTTSPGRDTREQYEEQRQPLDIRDLSSTSEMLAIPVRSRQCSHIYDPLRLEILRVFDPATLDGLINILQTFPCQFGQSITTSFIHPGLYGSGLPSSLKHAHDTCVRYQAPINNLWRTSMAGNLRLEFLQLLRLGLRSQSFTEMLAYAQAVVLIQIIRLLDNDGHHECHTDEDNIAMWTLTHRLWERAPSQLPSALNPWQAWLLSESVRRTLLVCNILLEAYYATRHGFAVQPLCIEALPFDMRTKAWDAHDSKAWEVVTSSWCEPSLVTFRQFLGTRTDGGGLSSFENLLLKAFQA